MQLESFHRFLNAAVNAGASDIHFTAGVPPAFRINGKLVPIQVPSLQPEDTERIASYILQQARYQGDLASVVEQDASYGLEGCGRFRVNVFRNRGTLAAILRTIPFDVPTFESLGLPPILAKIAEVERGLVLVTGVTGSGKSSTLAAMVNFINDKDRKHIITIEDPIEFFHANKNSRITQREIGPDTPSFASALRNALRQDPDVILVGEMRDAETIDIALKAAETGHLVLSTVHTTDTIRTINRLIGVFPPGVEHGVRHRLADCIHATVSQRLLPRASGKGRVAAAEIMICTRSIVEFIKDPKRTYEIKDYLEQNRGLLGTQSFDQHLLDLVKAQEITLELAKEAATNPGEMDRALALGA